MLYNFSIILCNLEYKCVLRSTHEIISFFSVNCCNNQRCISACIYTLIYVYS